ncbi:MAG: Bug family tripartite tricarboxylate transporter substrate binding protein [bacterium]|jgi:tripartite-type tricarboxylate transporter receptor subunit TctC|nr:tripartite tricarboxylate transporter substrate binding protein [Betaproteobacteria bacterium]
MNRLDLRSAAAFLLLAPCAGTALAQPAQSAQFDYPVKSVLFMVPQAAGGSTDTLARLIGQRLGDALGVTVVIENRPGANGIIGTEAALKAAPNGGTLIVSGTGIMAINPSLYPKLSYDPVRNFVAVANFGYSTSVLVAHPSLPVKTIADVIALAKKKPGAIKYASAGVGSSPHLSAALFQHLSGVDVLHVPYKGSTPGVSATLTGETEIMFTGVASALSFIKAGRLRPISINGPRRSPALPTVPTAGESGLPGFEADFWIGLFAPAGLPRPLVTRLNTEVNRILTADGMRERLGELGVDAVPGTPEQFGELLVRDIDRWAKAVKAAGLKGE